MNSEKRTIDYKRVVFILMGLALGILVLVFGDRVTTGNSEALRNLVTVFSILAGIMIAVVTAIIDNFALLEDAMRNINKISKLAINMI